MRHQRREFTEPTGAETDHEMNLHPTHQHTQGIPPGDSPPGEQPSDDRGALVLVERPKPGVLTILIPDGWTLETRQYLDFKRLEIHRYQS